MPKIKREPRSTRRSETSRGRHPMLKSGSIPHRAFNLLKIREDGLTSAEIAHGLMEPESTVRRHLCNMYVEGLVYRTAIMRGDDLQRGFGYVANRQAETGYSRDHIVIESVISVNEAGEYSVDSRILGELPTAYEDNPVPIQVVRHSVTVKKPEELVIKRLDHRDQKYDTIVINHR